MKNILFPIDFSDDTPHFFKFACSLAEAFGARLTMLHAFGLPINPNEGKSFEERAVIITKNLEDFVEKNKPKSANVKFNYIAKVGFAAEAILEFSEVENIDLIVMGTKGASNIIEKYFGGVSLSVLEDAKCPLLLIPSGAELNEWKHFGCTTNFNFDDLLVLNTLVKWGEKFNTNISCLHVLDDVDTNEAQSKLDLLKEVFDGKPIQFNLKSGVVKDAIELFESEANLDLLGMVRHNKNFLAHLIEEDLTKEVAKELKVPLLVFNK